MVPARRWAVIAAVALGGCSSRDEAPRAATSVVAPEAPAAADKDEPAAAAPAAEPPTYPPEVKSLRLRRSISVRLEPAEAAKRIGTVAQDTRVRARSARSGPGCETRWIEIEPRGWVCETHLEPSDRAPTGVELP